MANDRYARHEAFFGREGQARIQRTRYAIIGLGGTGSHVAQQLAFLGARDFRLVDQDRLDVTNLNRTVTAIPTDVDTPSLKVDVAARAIRAIQPEATVEVIPRSFISWEGYASIRSADVVFGCVDRHSARFILNEICQAYAIPYVDIATDISSKDPRSYGGHVHYSTDGERCVVCDGLLDQAELRRDFSTEEARRSEAAIYGVPVEALGETGPSVVSLNGVVASAAVLEFMVNLTGLRPAVRWLVYTGPFGTLAAKQDQPRSDCATCKGAFRGSREKSGVEHWIVEGYGERLSKR